MTEQRLRELREMVGLVEQWIGTVGEVLRDEAALPGPEWEWTDPATGLSSRPDFSLVRISPNLSSIRLAIFRDVHNRIRRELPPELSFAVVLIDPKSSARFTPDYLAVGPPEDIAGMLRGAAMELLRRVGRATVEPDAPAGDR